jgi:hypothetical protein
MRQRLSRPTPAPTSFAFFTGMVESEPGAFDEKSSMAKPPPASGRHVPRPKRDSDRSAFARPRR